MANTIPGGATQRPDGTWQDAEGKPLDRDKIAEAERLQAEQQAEHDRQEAARAEAALARDPAAAGFARALSNLNRPAEQAQPAPRRRGSEE